MGSSRDLMDDLDAAMEDANAMVTSNVTIPSGPFITPMPYPPSSINVNSSPFSFDLNGQLNQIAPLGMPQGSLGIGNSPVTSEMSVMTPHGKVKINLDTGVLTIPHGIGREEAIRDFWLGFQENFRGTEKTKYEQQIAEITRKADEYRNHANDVVKKSILKKIVEKYGNEKFIMMKPSDLIKMIEEA